MHKSMKAAIVLSVVMIFGFVGAGTAQAAALNDGFMTYTATPAGHYAGNLFYDVVATDPDGYQADGCLFFDPEPRSFKICCFENDVFWGWTIEGHWMGPGSPGFMVVNTGDFGQVEMNLGPAAAKDADDARCK